MWQENLGISLVVLLRYLTDHQGHYLDIIILAFAILEYFADIGGVHFQTMLIFFILFVNLVKLDFTSTLLI